MQLSQRSHLPLLLLLACGSGAAALIYEIVWFQLLELAIGSSAISLATLLATFMGGTCLGSLLFGRFVSNHLHPLRVFVAIELGIGVFGVLALVLIPFAGTLYTAWSGYGLPGFVFRGLVAAVCLLPPTLLMGATLPALSRNVEARWLGLLYGSNIAGAVIGCLLAGFHLLRLYDVQFATAVAVVINAAVATTALLFANQRPHHNAAVGNVFESVHSNATVYATIAISGFCALAAETVWTRLFGLLLGASVYTLSIILAVFLLGLGIGSGFGTLLVRSLTRPRLALGWCQLALAVAMAWTAYSLSASMPYWPINPTLSSDIWFTLQLDLDRAFWALLPSTILWGASFSLALAAAAPGVHDSGRVMAGVYAANTLGAIAGVLGATLLPILSVGSQRTEQLLIALSIVAGLLLLLPEMVAGPRWAGVGLGLGALLFGGILVRSVPPISDLLIAHGRYAATWVGKGDVLYAREGLNASVAVSSFPNGARTFHVAGKIQASNVPRDMRLQRMLGHMTSLTASRPRSVLVIGCGAGVTAGAVSIDPRVEQVTIVEIEPLVPQAASEYFSAHNFDVVRSPKVTTRIDDGRHYLLTTTERFDAITADPLDPWVKGAANLYTKEFFEAVKAHLNPGGVVTMYVQLFETTDEAVRSAVATFLGVFPSGTLWGNTYEGRGYDLVMLGQVEPLRIDLDEVEHRLSLPEYTAVAQSLREVGMNSAVALFSTYAGRGSDLAEWMKDAAINRDRNLRMQYLAGLGMDLDEAAGIYSSMLAHRRFPADLFASAEGRKVALREAIERGE